ncbi:hypothetical protein N9X92_06245 [Gammaproteobacteria bacterium]|nr:hypothetical protein [Gammaproteobacteria bacterium]
MFNRVKSLLALTVLATFGFASVATADEIVRTGEGRNFYNNISIPAGAETLYLSGSGASPMEDGSWGDMEQQTVDTFSKFKETLESQGWSMEDIVQVLHCLLIILRFLGMSLQLITHNYFLMRVSLMPH